ncbi:hypothetical protein AMAG_00050 [Allomyces macrogynus ATCC 38327]|uniref:Uncharacterized protein n=1 Tax=Allomyces macrogynus (strain ATCC 38327) TaxID=578462 RepID=A0A0L0RUK2_ALLM3|nr:hypothetical protein AMAG_00050 [Allomyces macrogynus ATCC 38327]|eukprot:KNE54047.1 hypothetical protein AMAG_00050 [Allomyces macrogynus ATCC 38327]
MVSLARLRVHDVAASDRELANDIPPSLTRHRFLISGDDSTLAVSVIEWLAAGAHIDRKVVPLPHCSSDEVLLVFTFLVEKKSMFHLRMRDSTEVPMSLNAMVQTSKSEAKLFGLKSDRLELVPVEMGKDELPLLIEFIYLPNSLALLAISEQNPYAYLDVLHAVLDLAYRNGGALRGLIYVGDYLSGQNPNTLTVFVDQFATLCPHVTFILGNYEPRTVIIDGSRYLDLTTRFIPIKARLDQRNVSFEMIPVITTEPLVDRPARTAFFHQQRASVVDALRPLVSESTVTSNTARIRKHVFVELWTGSVLASIDAVRAMTSEIKAMLDHDHSKLVQEAKLCADRVDGKTSKNSRMEAKFKRQEHRKPIYYLGQILMTTLAAFLARYINAAAAAAITGTFAVLFLVAVIDSQDAAEQLKTVRKKPKALISQLRKEKREADAKVKNIEAQLAAVHEWATMLDALQASVQDKFMTVAALLAMRGPLARLAESAVSGDPEPQADDLIDLVVSFLDNPDDKRALGEVLRALMPKIKTMPAVLPARLENVVNLPVMRAVPVLDYTQSAERVPAPQAAHNRHLIAALLTCAHSSTLGDADAGTA